MHTESSHGDHEENGAINTQKRLEAVLDSIPERGSNPQTDALAYGLRDLFFSPEFISTLRESGLDVEKVPFFFSENKIEISVIINYPNLAREATVRYRRGESPVFRLETEYGARTLYEEVLPEVLEDAVLRVRKIVEGLIAPK